MPAAFTTISGVRAAAILHPYVGESVLKRFRAPGVEIFQRNVLECNDLPDVALVFGGDGSVNRLLHALAHSQCPLLPVPTGSANDFARALGIGSRGEALLAWKRYLAKRDNVRTIDLGVLTEPEAEASDAEWKPPVPTMTFADPEGRFKKPESALAPHIQHNEMRHAVRLAEQARERIYFASVAGVGLDAAANEYASRMPRWMKRTGGYAISAMRALTTYKASTITVRAETASGTLSISGPVLIAAFGNSPFFGNGMRILPRARVDDGLLDLCFVRDVPKSRVIREFPKLYSGRHTELDVVEYAQVISVVIESDKPLPVCADGERVGITPVRASAAARALQVIVPAP
ncbi:MAG TPA: diacylglycerol kinase family protein [candidate division Zixibacteria bacterium]|nr:diacylglycerol kinase family protein [candidate division Zixibacteria bacterium]